MVSIDCTISSFTIQYNTYNSRNNKAAWDLTAKGEKIKRATKTLQIKLQQPVSFLLSHPLFSFSCFITPTHMLQNANLRCEGQRLVPGLLALSSRKAGSGLSKRWQKQNMAQTKTPEGARPS